MKNEIRRIFASNLQRLFKEKELQRNALADFVGVSDNTVTNWTHGHKMPRMDKVDLICRFFNVQRSDLLEIKQGYENDERRELIRLAESIPEERVAEAISYLSYLAQQKSRAAKRGVG